MPQIGYEFKINLCTLYLRGCGFHAKLAFSFKRCLFMCQRRGRKLVWPGEQANKLAKKFAWGDWG